MESDSCDQLRAQSWFVGEVNLDCTGRPGDTGFDGESSAGFSSQGASLACWAGAAGSAEGSLVPQMSALRI